VVAPGLAPNGASTQLFGNEFPNRGGGQVVMVMTLPRAEAALLTQDPDKFLQQAITNAPGAQGRAGH
jgi:hypothetical protein